MVSNNVVNLSHGKERRARRSANPYQAIRYQLEQVVKDFDLKACVISTQEGLLVSASGDLSQMEINFLAAIAPDLASDKESACSVTESISPLSEASPLHLHAQEFWLYGQPLVMLTAGEIGPEHELSACRAIIGVRRIARQFEASLAS